MQVNNKVNSIIWRGRSATESRPDQEPVMIYQKAFNPDLGHVKEMENLYKNGNLKEGDIKDELIAILQKFLQPIRERIKDLVSDPYQVDNLLKLGTEKAREEASTTLHELKRIMGLPQLI